MNSDHLDLEDKGLGKADVLSAVEGDVGGQQGRNNPAKEGSSKNERVKGIGSALRDLELLVGLQVQGANCRPRSRCMG